MTLAPIFFTIMTTITKEQCTKCGGDILLKDGAASRDYCGGCKKSMRVNWAAKVSNDRRARTLKKREVRTLN